MIKDPPFSKLDLVSCRNLLIYINGDLQNKLISLFHYALQPGGVLFLGTSETVGEFGERFATLDRVQKLYQRREDVPGAMRPVLGGFAPPLRAEGRDYARRLRNEARDEAPIDLRRLTEQALLAHYAQAALLVNGRGEVLHIFGRTGKYLEPAPGDAGMNVLTDGARRFTTCVDDRAAQSGDQKRTRDLPRAARAHQRRLRYASIWPCVQSRPILIKPPRRICF